MCTVPRGRKRMSYSKSKRRYVVCKGDREIASYV